MIRFAMVNPNGTIFQTVSAATMDEALVHGTDPAGTLHFILDDEQVSDATHYWAGGSFRPYPPRPGDWAIWNGAFWTDPRPPRDPVADLAARRATTSIWRGDMVLNAVRMGIIPEADAGPAARGEITPAIQALINQMPAEYRLEATVRWAASTEINRTNRFLLELGIAMNLTDDHLDQLTGVTPLPTEE